MRLFFPGTESREEVWDDALLSGGCAARVLFPGVLSVQN